MKSRRRGFTLIELLVVMAVLAILAAAALPLSELTVRRGKERELKAALVEIRGALDAYKRAVDTGHIAASGSGYPANLKLLVEGAPDLKNGGQPRYFLRRLPRDPFADPKLPSESTWVLRSYESPASAPKAGSDVYDVLSGSSETGLNGIPYREW